MKALFKWYINTWRKKDWSDSESLDMLFVSLYGFPIIAGLLMLIIAIINNLWITKK